MPYFKFGVHAAGVGGTYTGFGEYVAACKAAGVPCIVQAVDNAGPAQAVQALGRPFDVVVFRMTSREGINLDRANYSADPVAFARQRMADIARYWPAELDRRKVWTVPVNEPSKEPGDIGWLAAFTLECGRLSIENGWRHLGYGWSTGTPEPEFWELPAVLDYLRLCSQRPDLLGVSLHEYGLDDDITDAAPWLVWRFKFLHDACDLHRIPYPTIVIGEFGWREAALRPSPGTFRTQLEWAQAVYDQPNILGAAIWTLGNWHGTVAADLAAHMGELTQMATEYDYTPPDPDPDPPPDSRPKIVILKLPQEAQRVTWETGGSWAYDHFKRTMTASHDDMLTMLGAGNADSYALVVDTWQPSQQFAIQQLNAAGYRWEPMTLDDGNPPPVPDIRLSYRPCQTAVITQTFGANPAAYDDYGLPGHEGLDYAVPSGGAYFAAAAGTVVHASDRKWSSNEASAYGWHVVIHHGAYWTIYAHARAALPVTAGQTVKAGQVVGYSGNTGNSKRYHLHFGIGSSVDTGNGYPVWKYGQPIDPAPFVAGLQPPPTDPPPPTGQTIDIRPYIEPTGDVGQFTVLAHLGGAWTQDQQLQRRSDGTITLIKGRDYERWRIAANGDMLRYEDTSMSADAAYTQNGARWLPGVVTVGATYTNSPRVTVKRTADCAVLSDQVTTDYLTVAKLHAAWTSPANPALTFANVLEIHWRKSAGGPIQERYFLAPRLAYVAWGRDAVEAAVSELPQGRPSLPWQSWGCG